MAKEEMMMTMVWKREPEKVKDSYHDRGRDIQRSQMQLLVLMPTEAFAKFEAKPVAGVREAGRDTPAQHVTELCDQAWGVKK
jgi:hypothetical protein